MRIAIIGAGISGLSTAFYLQRARPDWELVIFDANPEPGGTMCTVERDGFRFEAGGNGFLTNKPDSLQLVQDAAAEQLGQTGLLPVHAEAAVELPQFLGAEAQRVGADQIVGGAGGVGPCVMVAGSDQALVVPQHQRVIDP